MFPGTGREAAAEREALMKSYYMGIDVSKGYADIAVLEESGGVCSCSGRHDDTPDGHNAVKGILEKLLGSEEEVSVVAGVESSGGLERNWLKMLKGQVTKVYLLNPLAVQMHLKKDLHRNVTDAQSAKGIAFYLRDGMRAKNMPYESSGLEGQVALYRCLRNATGRAAEMKNELQNLLPRVQPELVQFCRQGIPGWALSLLKAYPTAPGLAKAKAVKVAKIPFITLERAASLIENAKKSVASQDDVHTGMAVSFLSGELLAAEERLKEVKQMLCDELKDDVGVKIIQSIPGIGLWSAVCLRLEIGDIERFPTPECLVAYAGLDPRIHQSGDSERHCGISRRGRRQIRAILYLAALTAIRCNPVIRGFYCRLKEAGKKSMVALVACMRKLLYIIYGCWISGRDFDPDHQNKILLARRRGGAPDRESNNQRNTAPTPSLSLNAPISWREAKKRKAKALPQTRMTRDLRGLGSAFQIHCNTSDIKGTK
jgi:transposase